MGVAFDKADDDKIHTTVTIPIVQPGQAGVASGGIQVVSGIGKTLENAEVQIDHKIARFLTLLKCRQ